jgi:hypothetical protein
MSVTPSGNPSWVRSNDHTAFGGHVDKQNYMSQGVINAQTDVGAEAIARTAADLEAIERVLDFGEVTFTCNDTSPAAPTVNAAYLQSSPVRLSSYASGSPPSGFPSAARNGDGDVTFTFASSYTDAYGVAGAFGIYHATATLHGSAAGSATVDYTQGAVTVRVRAFDDAGAAIQDAKVTLTVS